MQAQAQVDALNAEGRTALHMAALKGHHKAMKALIDAGAAVSALDLEQRTPLMLSAGAPSSKCCKVLAGHISKNEPEALNLRDAEGMTALHWCAYYDNYKCADLLMKKGAQSVQDNTNKVPIHWTSGNTKAKTLNKILEHYPDTANSVDSDGRTIVHLALAAKNTVVLTALAANPGVSLSEPDNEQRTPLHWAVSLSDPALVTILLQSERADFTRQDEAGATPLHYSTQNDISCLLAILELGQTVPIPFGKVVDGDGRTELMWAVSAGGGLGPEQAAQMVNAIAPVTDVDAGDLTGQTALHHAAYMGFAEITEHLLAAQAHPDVQDDSHRTPLFRACEKGEIAVVEILAGVSFHPTDDTSPEEMLVDVDGRTPLHIAALAGYDDICIALLDAAPAYIQHEDLAGRTALHCAAYGAFTELMRLLIERGANVNAVDSEGITALHWAASTGNEEAVRELVLNGANPNSMEADGDKLTPFDYAADDEGNQFDNIIGLLQQAGGLPADRLKHFKAQQIQRAFRKYRGKMAAVGDASGKAAEVVKGKQIKTKNRDTRADIGQFNNSREAARKRSVELAADALDRQKRITERKAKEAASRDKDRKERESSRLLEQDRIDKARDDIITQSASIRSTYRKEKRRLANYHRKNNAAIHIQNWWRAIFRRRRRLLRKLQAKQGLMPNEGYILQNDDADLSLINLERERREEVKNVDNRRKSEMVLMKWMRTQDKTDNTVQACAALTIQLWWRQYKRKKYIAKAVDQRRAIMEEWHRTLQEENAKKATYKYLQAAERTYTERTIPRLYRAVPTGSTHPRPARILSTPAATSYNFAVNNYSSVRRRGRGNKSFLPRIPSASSVGSSKITASTRMANLQHHVSTLPHDRAIFAGYDENEYEDGLVTQLTRI